jgi:hypothetical protein
MGGNGWAVGRPTVTSGCAPEGTGANSRRSPRSPADLGERCRSIMAGGPAPSTTADLALRHFMQAGSETLVYLRHFE